MDTILGIYLVVSLLLLDIVGACLIGYGASNKEPGIVGVGIVMIFLMTALFFYSISEYHEPKAIEVYQGKTTLEYTVRDGVKVDSMVIYKNENHGSK